MWKYDPFVDIWFEFRQKLNRIQWQLTIIERMRALKQGNIKYQMIGIVFIMVIQTITTGFQVAACLPLIYRYLSPCQDYSASGLKDYLNSTIQVSPNNKIF